LKTVGEGEDKTMEAGGYDVKELRVWHSRISPDERS
jgi:hypothetical protein